jgi:sulfite exporter TauE/SafE
MPGSFLHPKKRAMSSETILLLTTAISIAFLHTAAGPDHYLPFIALQKARNWSYGKTIGWTLICGAGHILSSVVLGVGIAAIGWSLSKISFIEGIRGYIAGWLMFGFGFIYMIWGLYSAYKNKPHKHFDLEDDGSLYVYEHKHGQAVAPSERHKVTPWVMFIIFLLGPCEPMIPLLYFPAAQNNLSVMLLMILVYMIITLGTMAAIVTMGYLGTGFINTEKTSRYIHAIGGFTIAICGAGMLFMGW